MTSAEYLTDILAQVPRESLEEYELYFDRLWPILRSITGDGVRETHDILSELIPFERTEVPSGTQVFDWTVPKEWRVREAYVIAPDGSRILDVADNNLHLVNYSSAFRGTLSLEELSEHLHSYPDRPEAIPYLTTYYRDYWGFCLSEHMRAALQPGNYQVVVDTEHFEGSLTLSELVLPGETDQEVLLSTYTCHPSMANNELSGPLSVAFLYRRLAALPKRRLTYRFVFLPETIGSLTYLSLRGDHLKEKLVAGYVCTSLGRSAPLDFKRSRRGGSLADRAAAYVISSLEDGGEGVEFLPTGSDERQYCSPGFNLPVVCLSRGFWKYREYHSSLDDKSCITFDSLRKTTDALYLICQALDSAAVYRNLKPFGEPHLTRYDLYDTVGGRIPDDFVLNVLWVLNQCDGDSDLLAVAEKYGLDLFALDQAARVCVDKGLMTREDGHAPRN